MGSKLKTEKPRKRRLRTINNCCAANADVWNRLNRDELKPEIATKLTWILQVQSKMISENDLEKRVERIEDKVGFKK